MAEHPVPGARDPRPPLVLAADIGGTTMRIVAARGKDAGAPIVRVPTPNYLTHPRLDADAILDLLLRGITRAAAQLGAREPDVVVLGWPGPIVGDAALRSPTILGPERDRRFEVGAAARAWFPRAQVHVLNDLTCAGYHFVGQGFSDFCVLTVGSGIGNKVFLDGEPQVGARGFGGEIGHLRMAPAPGTALGHHVAELGSIASGRGTLWLADRWMRAELGLAPAAAADIPAHTSGEFVSAYRSGEPRAVAVVRAAAYPLATVLGALHLAIGLTQFFIIGGFAKALGPAYRATLVALCRELTWNVGQDWNGMITLGSPEIDEGLSGALHFGAEYQAGQLAC